MIDKSPSIRLAGLKDPAAVDSYFGSMMIDIAYVDSIGESSVDLLLEGVDLQKPNDLDWILGLLKGALSDCEETQARIELLNEPR
ncbi:MAG TPA: hypothetical protein VLQ45_24590 [Thermoanaerobaculia bacterium]|nr:hypothetical protein [Thermoanaerobaculia bacterium]